MKDVRVPAARDDPCSVPESLAETGRAVGVVQQSQSSWTAEFAQSWVRQVDIIIYIVG